MRVTQTIVFTAFWALLAGCGGDDTADTAGNVSTGTAGVDSTATGGAAGNVGSGGSRAGSSGSGSGGSAAGQGGASGASGTSGAAGTSGAGGTFSVDASANDASVHRDAVADSSEAAVDACSGKTCGDLCNSCPVEHPQCPGAVGHCSKQGTCEIIAPVVCD